jgi:hypothetical protein
MENQRKLSARRLLFLGIMCLSISSLSGCKSPEQKKKEREELLVTFTTGVVKHLLDHNPDTIRESITHLQKEELPEPVFEKLQADGVLPKTELGILKIIDEAQDSHSTNEVDVKSVKPLGPVEKDVVSFAVEGVEKDKQEGKPDQDKPFSCTVTTKLTEQSEGWPQVVEVTGLAPRAKPLTKVEEKPNVKKKKRHH